MFISVIFLGLRLWNLEKRINFSMDQGESMLMAYEIWSQRQITLIGPRASPVINGRHFFHGPITYYWLIIVGIIGDWDPVKITWIITLMSLISMVFLYKAAAKLFSKKVAILTIIIWTLLPKSIDFAGLIWNPNLLLIFVAPTLYVGILAIKDKKWWQFGLLGILLGWCLQCHFQAGLMIVLAGAVMNFKRIKLSKWIFYWRDL